MITALVLLVISFLAMLIMFVARLYEIKAGRQIVAVGVRQWAEKQAYQGVHVARGVAQVAVTKHFWTGLSVFVGRKFIDKVWHHPRVCVMTRKMFDIVKGKKEIKSNGEVSFYLKDVSEYKKKIH
jgi:hypothetical protein